MNGPGPQVRALHGFDFLDDPVLVVTLEGVVHEANAAARVFFGPRLAAGRLQALYGDSNPGSAQYLRMASGSTAPRPGKICFAREDGVVHMRTHASRSGRQAERAEIILRLLPESSDRFAVLDRRVQELDRQLQKRVQENAVLQETVRQNRLLVGELQHRVKNNIQLMISLINRAAQRHRTPEVAAVVATSRGRLQAMAAAQEALYQAQQADIVPARAFLEDVVRTIARASGAEDTISLTLIDARLKREEAHCLALIANELITNAARFGLRDGKGRIEVIFADEGGHFRFEVADDGIGMKTDAAERSSGLELVRGLCRQIGGRFEVTGDTGTRCRVRFPAKPYEGETDA